MSTISVLLQAEPLAYAIENGIGDRRRRAPLGEWGARRAPALQENAKSRMEGASIERQHSDNQQEHRPMNFADRDGSIWLDGEMVPWREAKVHVLTHTLHYGLGVFEGVRAYSTPDRGQR